MLDSRNPTPTKSFMTPDVTNPRHLALTIDNLCNPPPKPPSDYERSIDKSYGDELDKPKKGKQVPQLGEQAAQSVPPLKVFDGKAAQGYQQQIGSTTDYPIADVVCQYVPGEDLVKGRLTTKMRLLHNWYKKAAKEGTISIMVRVTEEHYFQEYAVSVEFSELFQLYNLRALDKSIISCYCL